jgi:hypothetical protein
LIEYFFVIRCYSTINQHSAAALTAQQRHHQSNRPVSEDDGKEGTTTTLIVTQDEVNLKNIFKKLFIISLYFQVLM